MYMSKRVKKKKKKKKQDNPRYLMILAVRPSENSKSIFLYIGHSGHGAGTVWRAGEWRRHIEVEKRTIASSGEEEYQLCQWTTASSGARTVKSQHM